MKTRRGEGGGVIEAGYSVPRRDRKTRRVRYQELEDELAYTAQELDRSVLAPNQIRTVLSAYRDTLFTDLFPGRKEVPKTLIFAKDDHHAEEIVTIAREVFGLGNDFAKKITYRVSLSLTDASTAAACPRSGGPPHNDPTAACHCPPAITRT